MESSSIEQALRTTVLGDTDVADSIGTRLYFSRAEKNSTMPYGVFFIVSDPHDPFAFGETQSGNPRVQFSVFDTDRYRALNICHKIRKVLRNYNGDMDGMTVHYCHAEGTRLISEPDRDVFHATFDVMPVYLDAS